MNLLMREWFLGKIEKSVGKEVLTREEICRIHNHHILLES